MIAIVVAIQILLIIAIGLIIAMINEIDQDIDHLRKSQDYWHKRFTEQFVEDDARMEEIQKRLDAQYCTDAVEEDGM